MALERRGGVDAAGTGGVGKGSVSAHASEQVCVLPLMRIPLALESWAGWKKLSARVRREQARLHGLVSDDAWHAHLRLEATVNERASLEAELIGRWAFDAGVRDGRRSRS